AARRVDAVGTRAADAGDPTGRFDDGHLCRPCARTGRRYKAPPAAGAFPQRRHAVHAGNGDGVVGSAPLIGTFARTWRAGVASRVRYRDPDGDFPMRYALIATVLLVIS